MKSQSCSQTITQVINKGKNVLYLVLKKKSFTQEIIDNINDELETRCQSFITKNLPQLNKLNPENPELFFECFLIRATIHILK